MLEFWYSIEDWPLSAHIGGTWWFPLLESIHVLAAVLVVAALLMVDLRLMNLAARRYAVTNLLRELLPWTWGGFAIAVITGAGMFIARASGYMYNTAFLSKLVLLLLAGANLLLVHRLVFRDLSRWDLSTPPFTARLAGSLSLMIWVGVIVAGRWTGHIAA